MGLAEMSDMIRNGELSHREANGMDCAWDCVDEDEYEDEEDCEDED